MQTAKTSKTTLTRKAISILLIFILTITMLPLGQLTPASAAPSDQAIVQRELVEQRTARSKVFDNGNGTFTRHVYMTDVFRNNGETWEAIRQHHQRPSPNLYKPLGHSTSQKAQRFYRQLVSAIFS